MSRPDELAPVQQGEDARLVVDDARHEPHDRRRSLEPDVREVGLERGSHGLRVAGGSDINSVAGDMGARGRTSFRARRSVLVTLSWAPGAIAVVKLWTGYLATVTVAPALQLTGGRRWCVACLAGCL